VKDTKNVTLNLPEPLLRKFRIYAATQNRSMTSLITDAIRKMVDPDDEYEAARTRLIQRMENATDLGTGGNITWKREDLYDRFR